MKNTFQLPNGSCEVTLMHNVNLFVEDFGHEAFIKAIVTRFANEYEVEILIKSYVFKDLTVCAIPDPHIERWLLIGSAAFKAVLGKGCAAPDYKCERDRYKKLLIQAIRDAGLSPLLGGMEHAEDIVNAMDLERMEQADDSLGKLIKALHKKFKEWNN